MASSCRSPAMASAAVAAAPRTITVCIVSDTHGHHRRLGRLPDADVLAHCGDFTSFGRKDKVRVCCGAHDCAVKPAAPEAELDLSVTCCWCGGTHVVP